MCSVLTHPAVPLALYVYFPEETVSPTLLLAGVACSIIPDLDVIGFRFGIRYNHLLGHRGLTHSIIFAATLAALLAFTLLRNRAGVQFLPFLYLFLSTLSHALLDMLTNGGLGVALFAPLSGERYFFPWRPIAVSPISVTRFFTARGLRVLESELVVVWLPALALA